MATLGERSSLEAAREGVKLRLVLAAMSPQPLPESPEILRGDSVGRRATGMLKWQKH